MSGALPTGLSLAATTGVLSGVPTTNVGSPFSFTIKALDAAARSATQVFSVPVNVPTTAPASATTEEFVCGNPCPFASWINVKASYGQGRRSLG